MKKPFFFLLLLAAAACKKNTDPTPPVKDILVKAWQVPGSTGKNYEYDSKNRLTLEAYTTSTSGACAYTYTGSTAAQRGINTSTGEVSFCRLYTLNSKGLAISMVDTSATDFITRYEYNEDGYITRQMDVQPSTGVVQTDYRYHYTNNVLDSTSLYSQNVWVSGYYYQYYTDKPNSLENVNYGLAFLGRQFRRPVKRAVRWSPLHTDTTWYSYTFDANQNISQQATLMQGATAPSTLNITYR